MERHRTSDEDELRAALRRLEVEHDVANILAASGSIADAMPQLLAALGRGLDWSYGGYWTCDADGQTLRCQHTWSRDEREEVFAAHARSASVPRATSWLGQIWTSAIPKWIPEVASEPSFLRASAAESAGLVCAAAFPVMLDEEVVGVLELFCSRSKARDADVLAMLRAIGANIGQFIARVRAYARLAEKRARLQLALEAGRLGPWEWDLVAGKVTWSPAVEAMHGIPEGSFGGTFEEYARDLHPDDRQRVMTTITETVAEKREHHLEYRIVRPDGEVRWLHARGRFVFDRSGEPVRLVGVCTDITEEKEQRLALEAALRGREDLLAIVSHDLRNPLGAIITALELLEHVDEGPDMVARVRRYAQTIGRAAQRMNRLIADLLDLASLERGQLRVEKRLIDAGSVVADTVQMLQPLAAQKEITLEAATPLGQVPIDGDRERIAQVLSNLIGNAIKFTPKGGRIDATAVIDGEVVRVAVADSGIGIAPEQLPHIFDRYWQGATRHARTGVGLGLSIAKGLVEAHGGRIDVRSEIGKGTTVELSVPLARR
jgi:PAS domain S-box-containing protein